MPFEKGKSGNAKGKPKGLVNKSKREFTVSLREMFEGNADKIAGWLEEIAKDDPKEALNQLNRWAEFCFPKLARNELTGKEGNELKIIIQKRD